MNPIIITTIIALVGFILSIFTASWLNQRHVEKLMEQLEKRMEDQGKRFEAKLETIAHTNQAEFAGVRTEIGHVNQRLDRIERQLDQIFKPALPRT